MTTSIDKYDVQPLFATPYFRADMSSAITQEQVSFIKNLKMVDNQQNLISEDLYIFNHPELKQIADAVQAALDVYAKEVMGLNAQLYVTQSWSLVNAPGVGMHGHSHSNSVVSGSLYYAEMPEPSSRMIFDRYNGYRRLELNPAKDKQNIFNTPMNVIVPRSHEILLFPSELTHQVEPNMSQKVRHSVAFNCFIKGELGDFRDVSRLML